METSRTHGIHWTFVFPDFRLPTFVRGLPVGPLRLTSPRAGSYPYAQPESGGARGGGDDHAVAGRNSPRDGDGLDVCLGSPRNRDPERLGDVPSPRRQLPGHRAVGEGSLPGILYDAGALPLQMADDADVDTTIKLAIYRAVAETGRVPDSARVAAAS